jgi:uncharacterized membrane protein/cytochrome c553
VKIVREVRVGRRRVLFGIAAMVASPAFGAAPAVADPALIERAIGRLHPVVIHFPIALLVAAAVFETVSALRRRGASPAAMGCLAMGAAGAAAAAVAGWFNAAYEHAGDVSSTLLVHRWTGIGAAVAAGLALLCAVPSMFSARALLAPYRGLVLAAAMLVGVAGHFGGNLTYGPGYWTDPLLALAGVGKGEPTSKDVPAAGAGLVEAPPGTVAKVSFPVDGVIDFDAHVKPILEASCVSCHGAKKRRGGLRLDTLEGLLKGGNGGDAIEVGNADDSYFIERVEGQGAEQRMPLELPPLPEEQVKILRAWIDQGAKWSAESKPGPVSVVAPEHDKEEVHWAYVAPADPLLPDVSDPTWCRTPLDRFVLANLEGRGMKPSPEADRETLIRRVTLDLTGLPPTIAEIDAFLSDSSADAFEKVVDRLLASPAYGERWARVWLDLARYADSRGYEKDQRWSLWPYRDWVINALNQDMPFDRFTIEQLAGDLLPDATLDQRIATGFNRCSMVNEEGGVDPEEARVAAVLDRTNTTATVWLGTTLACAQCHDHKYDPFSQKDYFRFFAFFNSTPVETHDLGSGETRVQTPQLKLPRPDEPELTARLAAVEMLLESLGEPGAERDRATKERDELRATLRSGPTTEVMEELAEPRKTRVFVRGSFLTPGDAVEADTPALLPPLGEGVKRDRLALASWLVRRDNPLTARVQVNRIWSQHFGRGIVETEEDFGTRASEPSNLRLLDHLATRFVAMGWSQKALHRLIVTSATYRQSSAVSAALLEADPHNTWLARGPRFRLDAEAIRDTALAASGLLSSKMGGPSVFPNQPPGVWGHAYSSDDWVQSRGEDRHRRGIYTFIKRATPYPSFAVFDAPARQVSCTRRSRTNTPLAALTTLNDPAFFECAVALGGRAMFDAAAGGTDRSRIVYVFRLCTGRTPRDAEIERLRVFLDEQRSAFGADPAEADRMLGGFDASIAAGAATPEAKAELAAWAMVGNVLLNLDETLNLS